MKIGLLYPSSKAHPHIAFDFLEGLRAGLADKGVLDAVQLLAENIGFGGQEKEVYQKAEKLLLLDGVDLLVAYVDLRVMPQLQPLFKASGKMVIAVHHGANYPQDWTPEPNVVNLSLQHSFLCWLTGKLAAEGAAAMAAYATSFYDCGYLHTAALVKSFIRNGGEIRFNYINRQSYDDAFEIGELLRYLSANNDVNRLLCVFDSLPASLFYSRLKSFETAQLLQLYVSPMMLEPGAFDDNGKAMPFSINGYLPWLASGNTEANRNFVQDIQQKTKRTAGIFSLLGWETALVTSAILAISRNDYSDGSFLCRKLYGTSIPSPRGELKLDKETNYFIAPVVKFRLEAGADKPETTVLTFPAEDWKAFVCEPLEGINTGWMNTYLCY